MKYNELKTKPVKKGKRVGRGIAAGQGKTAGRGTKGQGARTGSRKKPGFAGGSNPLMQKLPKLPGFTSHKVAPENVYTGDLNQFAGKKVDAVVLADAKLISSPFVSVKLIINNGELTSKVDVSLTGASQSAIAVLEEKGGSFTKTERLQRPESKVKAEKAEKSKAAKAKKA
jgi:large subunit ribosomal protein L15